MAERLTMKYALVYHEGHDTGHLVLAWTEFGAEITLGIAGRTYRLLTTGCRETAEDKWREIIERYEEALGFNVVGEADAYDVDAPNGRATVQCSYSTGFHPALNPWSAHPPQEGRER
jgi:hypothetical protein